MSGSADIGIRVFLDDAASSGLYAINGTLGSIGSKVLSASGAMHGLTSNLAALGVAAGFGASLLAFGAAIKYSVDAASELQQSMFNVAVATHVPMSEAEKYTNTLMNLGATSTYTTKEIADGIVILGRSGYSIGDIMSKMAEAGVALGIATRTSATQGFQLLAQAMTAYSAPASEAMHYADMLQFAYEHQTGSVEQLRSALAAVTPAAARLNVPFREIAAALDVVGPAMGNTSMAGTALRYMLQGVTSPTNQAIDALASLGIITVSSTTPAMQKFAAQLLATGKVNSDFIKQNDDSVYGLKQLFGAAQQAGLIKLDAKFNEWAASSGLMQNAFFDAHGKAKDLSAIIQILADHMKGMNDEAKAAYLKDIFSVRGGQGAQILLQQIEKYKQELGQLAKSHDNAGGAMRRWDEVMKTLQGAISGLQTSLRDLGVVIGNAILPWLTRVITQFNQFVTWVRTIAAANPQAAAGFLKLGAALSAVGLVAGLILMIIMGVGTGFMAFIGIIVGVVAAVIGLTIGITMVTNWFRNLIATSAPVRNFLGAIGTLFRDTGSFISGAFGTAITFIKQQFAGLIPDLAQLLPFLRMLGIGLAVVAGIILGVIVVALHVLVGALSGLIVIVVGVVTGIIRVFTGLIGFFTGLFNVIVGLCTGNGARIQAGFHQMVTGVLSILGGLFQAIGSIFVGGLMFIIGVIGGFISGVVHYFSFLSNILVGHSIIPDMFSAIKNVFVSGLTFLIGFVISFVSNLISNFLRMGSQVIATATNAFNTFRNVVSIALMFIVALVMSAASQMIGRMIAFGSQIVSTATNAWNSFRNAVSNGINGAIGFVQSLPGKILGILSGLPNMLFNSGATAMSQFASGLASTLGQVVSQVQAAAGKVADFLSHHSPAKMGPLADDDKWMPNMMKMMAKGIHENVPLLQQAANRAAGSIASAPSNSRIGGSMVSGSGGGTGGTTIVNLVLDGQVIGQAAIDHLTGQLQLNGAGRAFR